MKKSISILFMLTAIVLGFAACTDADMGSNVTYDERQALTSWQSEYLEDSTECNISYSLNAKGDTTCTMAFTAVASDGSIVPLLCTDGKISYDQVTGMTTIDFATSPFGYPLRVYSILQSNKQYSSVQIFFRVPVTNNNGQTVYYESKYESFRAINTKPALKSQLWVSKDESYAFIFGDEGVLAYQVPGTAEGEGTYTYDLTTGNGTVNLADGTTGTISVNALNQVVVTINGEDHVVYPTFM